MHVFGKKGVPKNRLRTAGPLTRTGLTSFTYDAENYNIYMKRNVHRHTQPVYALANRFSFGLYRNSKLIFVFNPFVFVILCNPMFLLHVLDENIVKSVYVRKKIMHNNKTDALGPCQRTDLGRLVISCV